MYEDILTRLSNVVQSRSAKVMWEGNHIADFIEEVNVTGLTGYIIRIHWDVYDKCRAQGMWWFPGIDDTLRCDEYVRTGILPTFIYRRTPDPKRPELPRMLKEIGMSHYDRFEFMLRTGGRRVGDDFYVERFEEQAEPIVALRNSVKQLELS